MKYMKNTDKHVYLLTGSFLLNTLNGDNVKNCGDVDVVHIHKKCLCFEYNSYQLQSLSENDSNKNTKTNEQVDITSAFCDNGYIDELNDQYTYEGHPSSSNISNIRNINIKGKKLQLINVGLDNFKQYFDEFDLDICQNYYSKNFHKTVYIKSISNVVLRKSTIYLDSKYFFKFKSSSNINKSRNMNILDYCDLIYERLCKYICRGYTLYIFSQKNMGILRQNMHKLEVESFPSNTLMDELNCYFPNADEENVTEFIKQTTKRNTFDMYAYTWISYWERKLICASLIMPKVIDNGKSNDNEIKII